METHARHCHLWPLLLASALLAGCTAARKKPIFEQPGTDMASIAGEITVLSPVDARLDKKIKVDLHKQIREKVQKALRKRGYQVGQSDNPGEAGAITEEDLRDAKPEWIRRLGPPGSRWVMVLCLQDVTTKLTFGSTGNAEIAGYVYDRENGQLIWRDKGIGQAGQGGLAGMVVKGLMDNEAINAAVSNLVASIPKRRR